MADFSLSDIRSMLPDRDDNDLVWIIMLFLLWGRNGFGGNDNGALTRADLNDGLNKIFPEQKDWSTYRYPGLDHFEEVESWPSAASYLPGGDRTMLWNGDAHLRSTIVGGNQTFEVEDGKLQMNGLASIFFVDYDRTRERTRKIRVIVLGE